MILRRFLTIAGYTGLTLLVVGVTVALVAYGNDYVYDFKSGQIIQRGHVIINSIPNGIRVVEDGKELKKKTPYQAAHRVGTKTFSLIKDGYWSWQKTLQVVAGQVVLAKYVILVPKKPATEVIDSQAKIVAQAMSKDHRHLAYIAEGAKAGVYIVDPGSPKPTRLYAPKAATETEAAEVLTDVKWSDDASHLLIVSRIGDQVVHRLASSNGGEPANLTAQYRFNLSGAVFSAETWKHLYWISPEGLRRLDVDGRSVSAVLADKVTQFWVIPDRVLYVQQTPLGRSLWSIDTKGRRQELIQALPESAAYSVAYANYQGKDHLAVVPEATRTGTLYTGIFGNNPVAKTIAHDVTKASFSPEGKMLAFSSPTAVWTYDLERSSVMDSSVVYEVTGQAGDLQALTWFDDYHFLLTRDGKLIWSEFDGANTVELGTSEPSFPAYVTSDERSVVMFEHHSAGVQIKKLVIKQ